MTLSALFLLSAILCRPTQAHPKGLECASDLDSRLQVNQTIMHLQTVPSPVHSSIVSFKLTPLKQHVEIIVPSGYFFAARVDRGAVLTPANTLTTAKCTNQVYTLDATNSTQTYLLQYSQVTTTNTLLTVGYTTINLSPVKIIHFSLPKTSDPAPTPAPLAPSPSSVKPQFIGHGDNITLGDVPGMSMDFRGYDVHKTNGDAGATFTIRFKGEQTWIGFGFSAKGMMGSKTEGSELYACCVNQNVANSSHLVQRFWVTGGNGQPTGGVPVESSVCTYDKDGASMIFSRQQVETDVLTALSSPQSRPMTPGKKQVRNFPVFI